MADALPSSPDRRRARCNRDLIVDQQRNASPGLRPRLSPTQMLSCRGDTCSAFFRRSTGDLGKIAVRAAELAFGDQIEANERKRLLGARR